MKEAMKITKGITPVKIKIGRVEKAGIKGGGSPLKTTKRKRKLLEPGLDQKKIE